MLPGLLESGRILIQRCKRLGFILIFIESSCTDSLCMNCVLWKFFYAEHERNHQVSYFILSYPVLGTHRNCTDDQCSRLAAGKCGPLRPYLWSIRKPFSATIPFCIAQIDVPTYSHHTTCWCTDVHTYFIHASSSQQRANPTNISCAAPATLKLTSPFRKGNEKRLLITVRTAKPLS